MKPLTIFRLVRMLLHVLKGMAVCATIFPFLGEDKRNWHIRRWSKKLLAICNVTVELAPGSAPALEHSMVVANHVSWLDIFVVHSLYPSHFVAKAEIRSWPLAGWLAEKAGTVFIARGNRRDLRHIFKGLVHSLEQGRRVAFFPEGTTAAQGALLPFHANLFEAAVDASAMVQPFALSYRDAGGASHPSVDFIGETSFVQSIMWILNGPRVHARLTVLPPVDGAGAHRRELAEVTHQAIASALGVVPAPAGTHTQHGFPLARE